MRVYLVEKICDYEYGCTEVVKAFFNEKSASEYINKTPVVGNSTLWQESKAPTTNHTLSKDAK